LGGDQVLEQQIDAMDASLPPLTNFILPSGGVAAASLHCCRSICRRAERGLVPLLREGQVDVQAYTYLNRLSDYFFAAARFAASETGAVETVWEPGKF
jgi:ATP:cob(I)alamin adenosyltransferase